MLLFFHRDVDITGTSSQLYHPSTSKEASCLNALPSLNSVVGNPYSSFSEIPVPQQSQDSESNESDESDESGESCNDDFDEQFIFGDMQFEKFVNNYYLIIIYLCKAH